MGAAEQHPPARTGGYLEPLSAPEQNTTPHRSPQQADLIGHDFGAGAAYAAASLDAYLGEEFP